MATADLQAAIDRLLGVPLDAFVAERTRLARELRTGGDRPAAAELARLPKPTPPAWALNQIAREDPGAVEAWLEAAAMLRDASTHAAERGGDAVRAAMAAHRAATSQLMATVAERAQPGGRPLSPAMVERVRALLQAATADPELAERLRTGRVAEEAAADDAARGPGIDGEQPAARGKQEEGARSGGGAARRGRPKRDAAPTPTGDARSEARPKPAKTKRAGESEGEAAEAKRAGKSDGEAAGKSEAAAPGAVHAESEREAGPPREGHAKRAPGKGSGRSAEAETPDAGGARNARAERERRNEQERRERRAELDRRVTAAIERLERLRATAAERAAAAEAAEARLDEAGRALRRCESEAAAARAAATDAHDAGRTAEHELRQLRDSLRRAGG